MSVVEIGSIVCGGLPSLSVGDPYPVSVGEKLYPPLNPLVVGLLGKICEELEVGMGDNVVTDSNGVELVADVSGSEQGVLSEGKGRVVTSDDWPGETLVVLTVTERVVSSTALELLGVDAESVTTVVVHVDNGEFDAMLEVVADGDVVGIGQIVTSDGDPDVTDELWPATSVTSVVKLKTVLE